MLTQTDAQTLEAARTRWQDLLSFLAVRATGPLPGQDTGAAAGEDDELGRVQNGVVQVEAGEPGAPAAEEETGPPAPDVPLDKDRDLVIRAQAGDEAATMQLLSRYRRYACMMAYQLKEATLISHDLDDLVQEGRIALLKAVNEYRPDDPFPFGIRVMKEIKWRMLDSVQSDSMLRTPAGQAVHRALREFEAAGITPSIEEVAAHAGCTVETARRAMAARSAPLSLDHPLDDDETRELYAVVPDAPGRPTEDAALSAIEQEERRAAVKGALESLDARYRHILER